MKIQSECLPCVLNMAVTAVKRVGVAENEARGLMGRIMSLPALQGPDWNLTSPEIIEHIMIELAGFLGLSDPFRSIRAEMNRRAESLVPDMVERIANSDRPLAEAARLAILGNAIDFMSPDIERAMERSVSTSDGAFFDEETVDRLNRRVASAERIVILGDNAGEIVFDRLLLREIRRRSQAETTYIVRSRPTMNDALLSDAQEAGLDREARVIENGINGPLPGTKIDRCSAEAAELIRTADLIISKGGGNFDTLHEELDQTGPVTFMFLSKCRPYRDLFRTEIGGPILVNY